MVVVKLDDFLQHINHQLAYGEIPFFFKLVCQKKMIWWIAEYLQFNPLQTYACLHILHTVLCTFSIVLTRRICFTIKSCFSW